MPRGYGERKTRTEYPPMHRPVCSLTFDAAVCRCCETTCALLQFLADCGLLAAVSAMVNGCPNRVVKDVGVGVGNRVSHWRCRNGRRRGVCGCRCVPTRLCLSPDALEWFKSTSNGGGRMRCPCSTELSPTWTPRVVRKTIACGSVKSVGILLIPGPHLERGDSNRLHAKIKWKVSPESANGVTTYLLSSAERLVARPGPEGVGCKIIGET